MIVFKNPVLLGIVLLVVEYFLHHFIFKVNGMNVNLLLIPIAFALAGIISALVLRKKSTCRHVLILIATYFGIGLAVGTCMLILADVTLVQFQVGALYLLFLVVGLISFFTFTLSERFIVKSFKI